MHVCIVAYIYEYAISVPKPHELAEILVSDYFGGDVPVVKCLADLPHIKNIMMPNIICFIFAGSFWF